MNMIINTVVYQTNAATITYEEIAALAHIEPVRVPTIIYYRGPIEKPEGELVADESVRLQNGIVFNAAITGGA